MATHGAIHTITMSTKSSRYVVKDELKMAYMVIPNAMTQSTSTAWYRLTGRPMAWSVIPDEYMSRLLMANSWTMAKMRKITTNQAGMKLWWAKDKRPPEPVPMLRRNVPTTAPRVMMRISGTAVPRKIQPTRPFLE